MIAYVLQLSGLSYTVQTASDRVPSVRRPNHFVLLGSTRFRASLQAAAPVLCWSAPVFFLSFITISWKRVITAHCLQLLLRSSHTPFPILSVLRAHLNQSSPLWGQIGWCKEIKTL